MSNVHDLDWARQTPKSKTAIKEMKLPSRLREKRRHYDPERIVAFYEGVHEFTARQWPRGIRENPYYFGWRDEPQRELVLHALSQIQRNNGTFYTDAPGKDILRLLFYWWRTAKTANRITDDALAGYRWRWHSQEEISQATGKSVDMIKKLMKRLSDRRLIVRATPWVPGKLQVTYYRPSDDLFRVLLCVTRCTDKDYIKSVTGGAFDPTKEDVIAFQNLSDSIFRTDREELFDLLHKFSTGTKEGRSVAFCKGFNKIYDGAWERLGMDGDGLDELYEGGLCEDC